ncbi:DNA methyltransferase [Ruminococcus flavefaciens]|uniref:DNA methyltransferase n=1 Tax=Ruminococcus flavefaciens TaxID=1265 RepID=UPI0026EEEB50|nr:DNA methyltransferase [Ruminococcus flavefaciens]
MTDKERIQAAKEFAARWEGRGDEKQETQLFWIDLLQNVLGVENPTSIIQFEKPVVIEKNTKFIDGFIPSTKVLIEQKSIEKKLGKTAVQSDGEKLTPYGQAFRYNNYLPYEDRARWIIVSNFERIMIYNMNKPNGEPDEILLKDLPKQFYQLQFIVEQKSEILKKEEQISIDAGELVGKLYNALIKQYKNPDSPETLKSLNMLCVRLVFCLYAEDSQIFPKHEMFGTYLKQFPTKEVHKKLRELFKILDMTQEQRDEYDPYMDDELSAFPYVNGGLFADEKIEIPPFIDEIVDILVNKASAGFDWSEISPTIFGAVFESTLNPETRRSGGMHYTSIENIHKVIDPLFLSDLRKELDTYIAYKDERTRKQRLSEFRSKLASLVFFDPACGSGNFLTETYLSIRKLENEALFEENHLQATFGMDDMIQVSINQFYGIEINDFAVAVARTALWIAEHKMLRETEDIMQVNLDFLPLKSYKDHIIEGNALRIDWESVVPKEKLSYIMGNPPFVGARLMGQEQKDDVFAIFDGVKNNGNLDYVACWYKKAADLMRGTAIRTALVSTNSITQGEQVAILWKTLFEQGVHIDFAHRTFRWDSESNSKAQVHCVIVGFSLINHNSPKKIYDNGAEKIVKNINGYLVEADDVIIESRSKPISDVPLIGMGNQPIDDGNYLFTPEEKDNFILCEPQSEQFFHPWMGAKEFINGSFRYCLWLGECSPRQLRSMPECLKRVEAVRSYRLSSKRKSTLKLADSPTRFQTENMPQTNYIVIPEVSSERRKYIPIGFMTPNTLCSNKLRLMPNASLFHFGILTSNVHMAWMRAVAGRLEMRYDYSINIVYNNFPWCNPTSEQKAKIEKTAQMILDARALYPDSSLADLYDELTMPPELRKAHQANDRAVMEAYGFWGKLNTESECVAELMKMYQRLTEGK